MTLIIQWRFLIYFSRKMRLQFSNNAKRFCLNEEDARKNASIILKRRSLQHIQLIFNQGTQLRFRFWI